LGTRNEPDENYNYERLLSTSKGGNAAIVQGATVGMDFGHSLFMLGIRGKKKKLQPSKKT
jgi:hypothetical protein